MELIQRRKRRMPKPLTRSRTEMLRSPILKESMRRKSRVVCRSPKKCRAARPKARIATRRNQALLLMNPDINR